MNSQATRGIASARPREQVLIEQRAEAPTLPARADDDAIDVAEALVARSEPREIVVAIRGALAHREQECGDLAVDDGDAVASGERGELAEARAVHRARVAYFGRVERDDGVMVGGARVAQQDRHAAVIREHPPGTQRAGSTITAVPYASTSVTPWAISFAS